MKIKINRNIFWTTIFVKRLYSMGVKNACISPGSRSTPLTLAFAADKKIKSYVHIDERSSAFFALGLAKATGKPAAVVCTSGTASVELYPAIVEAYQQRIPLIICTADRPPEQRGKGANQTINQDNLYNNHIRTFINAGLPSADREGADKICTIAEKAYVTAIQESGPVHINFPFSKPFEPDSFTDEIDNELLFTSLSHSNNISLPAAKPGSWFYDLMNNLQEGKRALFIAGPGSPDPGFNYYCTALSGLTGTPLFADVYSHLRFGSNKKNNIITTYDAMLRDESFRKKVKPDLIIQFNRTPTSKVLLNFLADSPARKIMINTFGDWFDPSNSAETAYAMDPADFCRYAVSYLNNVSYDPEWLNLFTSVEKELNNLRNEALSEVPIIYESKVIRDVIQAIPSNTAIMVSNSSPVRELDNFSPLLKKNINLFYNRGASGIDGIVSTALGISAGLKKPAVLITGDLAFFYDITSLFAGRQNNIPLAVILINNNGGGIFNNLPISRYKRIFQKYFITPHNLEFGSLVKSFGWNYKLIRTSSDLKSKLLESLKSGSSTVLEIKTDAKLSLVLRKKFWAASSKLTKNSELKTKNDIDVG